VLVFALVGAVWIIYAARILLRGLARYVGMTALVLGWVLAIGGLIIHMIDYATYFAVYNWEVAARRITPSVCASQATYAAIDRQSQIAPLGRIGDGAMHAGLDIVTALAIVYCGYLMLSPRARDVVRERGRIWRKGHGIPSNSE
jgi:hypothetical protein